MKIETFALERWMTTYELDVRYDIAESGIYPLTVRELLDRESPAERVQILDRLLDLRLGYSEARGTLELRSLLAETYEDCTPENILVTTGAIEANFLLFNVLLEAGDHVIFVGRVVASHMHEDASARRLYALGNEQLGPVRPD